MHRFLDHGIMEIQIDPDPNMGALKMAHAKEREVACPELISLKAYKVEEALNHLIGVLP